jgi:hypothetical protein
MDGRMDGGETQVGCLLATRDENAELRARAAAAVALGAVREREAARATARVQREADGLRTKLTAAEAAAAAARHAKDDVAALTSQVRRESSTRLEKSTPYPTVHETRPFFPGTTNELAASSTV